MTDTTAGEDLIDRLKAMASVLREVDRKIYQTTIPTNPGPSVALQHAMLAIEAAEALAAQPAAGAQGEAVAWVRQSKQNPDAWYQVSGERDLKFYRGEGDRVLGVYDPPIATPAQPDTGDVAALREALVETLSEWFDRIPGFEDTGNGTIRGRYPTGFNDVEFDHIALATDILAALSKPNAPGAA